VTRIGGPLPVNRSIPATDVIPVLTYPDVPSAVEFLSRAFGFVERLRIGDHRVQMLVGSGAIVVAAGPPSPARAEAPATHSVMIRVADAHAHCERARSAGATIISPPTDFPYGERQYSAVDPTGHRWTFTQTIADADPADWGGLLLR
jgi:uncharacterized glyoxalase superfamily protein PhnB